MTRSFEDSFSVKELGVRVRAIIGIPEEILDDGVINSPTFKIKASKYINKEITSFLSEYPLYKNPISALLKPSGG